MSSPNESDLTSTFDSFENFDSFDVENNLKLEAVEMSEHDGDLPNNTDLVADLSDFCEVFIDEYVSTELKKKLSNKCPKCQMDIQISEEFGCMACLECSQCPTEMLVNDPTLEKQLEVPSLKEFQNTKHLEEEQIKKMTAIPNNNKPFHCRHCNKYSENIDVIQHLNQYSNVHCETCNKEDINIQYELRYGVEMHEPEKTSILSTNELTEDTADSLIPTLVNENNFQDELSFTLSVNSRDKLFKCNLCGVKFNDRRSINSHLPRHRNLQWLTCEEELDVNCNLTKAMEIFQCYKCSANFFDQNLYMEHMYKHRRRSNFKCTICHQVFSLQALVDEHNRRHSEWNTFQCKYCDKRFYLSVLFIRHLEEEHSNVI